MTVAEFVPIVFGVSLAAGFLGLLTGLGGGVVVTPVLTLFLGVDLRYAIGASLVSVIATSSGTAAAYVRDGFSNIRVGMFGKSQPHWAPCAARSWGHGCGHVEATVNDSSGNTAVDCDADFAGGSGVGGLCDGTRPAIYGYFGDCTGAAFVQFERTALETAAVRE